MTALEEIIKSKAKPKEKVMLLAQKLRLDKKLISEMAKFFDKASDAEKGICIEAVEYITKEDPKFVQPCLAFVIEQINHRAPKVKWEASRVVANVAKEFPDEVAKAIPKLLTNTKDDGTVVRWSAALALT
jgi:hypothetical protein